MIFEICTDNIAGALIADKYKVKRIELCSALNVGGLTPSFGLIEECVFDSKVEVHVMIRPIAGNFVYSDYEFKIMRKDISMIKAACGSGAVFGCLTPGNKLDIEQNKTLINRSTHLGLQTTFHRAFDFIINQEEALEQLIELGFDRVLTSGKKPKAIEGIKNIEKLVKQAKGRIEIMVGSGVNQTNALALAKVGVDALHFTAHTVADNPIDLGMGDRTVINESKIKSIINLF